MEGMAINNGQKQLKKLKRKELLQIMVEQNRENDRLKEELRNAREALKNRKIVIEKNGSLAEACMEIFHVVDDVQKAADLYLENIRMQAEESGVDDGSK